MLAPQSPLQYILDAFQVQDNLIIPAYRFPFLFN